MKEKWFKLLGRFLCAMGEHAYEAPKSKQYVFSRCKRCGEPFLA